MNKCEEELYSLVPLSKGDSVEVGKRLGGPHLPPCACTIHVCVCVFVIGPRHGSDLACQKLREPRRPMGELERTERGWAQGARRTPFGSIAGQIGTAI